MKTCTVLLMSACKPFINLLTSGMAAGSFSFNFATEAICFTSKVQTPVQKSSYSAAMADAIIALWSLSVGVAGTDALPPPPAAAPAAVATAGAALCAVARSLVSLPISSSFSCNSCLFLNSMVTTCSSVCIVFIFLVSSRLAAWSVSRSPSFFLLCAYIRLIATTLASRVSRSASSRCFSACRATPLSKLCAPRARLCCSCIPRRLMCSIMADTSDGSMHTQGEEATLK